MWLCQVRTASCRCLLLSGSWCWLLGVAVLILPSPRNTGSPCAMSWQHSLQLNHCPVTMVSYMNCQAAICKCVWETWSAFLMCFMPCSCFQLSGQQPHVWGPRIPYLPSDTQRLQWCWGLFPWTLLLPCEPGWRRLLCLYLHQCMPRCAIPSLAPPRL